MSEVERGTSKDKYLTGNSKRTVVDQKSGLPPLRTPLRKSDSLLWRMGAKLKLAT
jgi:hypothetical protein